MISLEGLTKSYTLNGNGRHHTAIDSLSLSVKAGEFIAVFGPNGSGKTTLLNIVGGLDDEYNGTVTVGGKKPRDTNIGFVFQNYNDSLFPWKTVLENVMYPLVSHKVEEKEAMKRSLEVLGRVRLDHKKDEYIYNLSGGQRQLVSICRAFVRNPDVLILDEPCSALDYQTTKNVDLEIQKLWQESKIPVLCVSHDVDEAVFLADKVVVLSPAPGRIKAIIDVPIPRPRTLETFTTEEFFRIRTQVLENFVYA